MPDHNLHENTGFFGIRPPVGALRSRFIMPPFSLWNTRDGEWRARRRLWIAKGIQSELGRSGKLLNSGNKRRADWGEYDQKVNDAWGGAGTSVFDPVVCELAYRWWCPPGGVVLDPFAGGSVRGIVASLEGYRYAGIELRHEQVAANIAQLNEHTTGPYKPRWRQGDSFEEMPKAPRCDFFFSCPPYGNLEKYSDDPADISNMKYPEFLERYRGIIRAGVGKLREDSFACFVVANYRDDGVLVNFVGDTVRAFEDAGATFYNDIVLINAVGSGAIRANSTFIRGNRKVVKAHQNILVFLKGDAKKAAAKIPADDGK